MSLNSVINNVADTFETFGLQVKRITGEKEAPYEAALVDFGLDEEERPVVLQALHYSQNILSFLDENIQEKGDIDLSILSFIITVPGEIPEEKTLEVLRLIALSNKSLPLGALNFSEVERSVYYSYNLPVFEKAPDEVCLLTVVHAALFVKETFFATVDEIATGRSTLEEILNKKTNS